MHGIDYLSLVWLTFKYSGFLDNAGRITQSGQYAAGFPVSPLWIYALQTASKRKCLGEMTVLASIASAQQSIFLRPLSHQHVADLSRHQFVHPLSDHITGLNAVYAYSRALRELQDKSAVAEVRIKPMVSPTLLHTC